MGPGPCGTGVAVSSCIPAVACEEEMSLVSRWCSGEDPSQLGHRDSTSHAGVQVLSTALCCLSAETVWVVGCFEVILPEALVVRRCRAS